ncbi:MAG: carboxylate--amine ligase [Halobacteriales archaeon]|nr:carboxylate--amine ligase [Halobacteriales archaeon]
MADTFHPFEDLLAVLEDRSFDRPPAVISNAHITGLAVARALATADIPVIALDQASNGVATYSDAVTLGGAVTYPLSDRAGFKHDLEAIVDAAGTDVVAFGCMDEWVHALARTDPDGVRLPFAPFETVDSVLNKATLYDRARRLDVPIPRTFRLDEVDPDRAAEELGFPLVVKPALKRRFEDTFGTNLVIADDRGEYDDIVAQADDAGLVVLAQEYIPKRQGDLYTVGSYTAPTDSDPITFVGRRQAVYPPDVGTTCLVESATAPAIEADARTILDDAGYYGISEAEFLYDRETDTYRLLDINTRPWKWVGLPVFAGANLPLAAYADVTNSSYDPGPTTDATWVYLKDYAALVAETEFADRLSATDWQSILSGGFESNSRLTTAVYRPSDPAPAYQLLSTEFGNNDYYCAC